MHPNRFATNLFVARWAGEDCLKEYLLHLLKLESIVQLFFENRVMKSLIQAAPGLRELALVGKITSGIRGVGPALPFDRFGHRWVFDRPFSRLDRVAAGDG